MKKILYSSLFLSVLQSILFWNKSAGISVFLFLTSVILLIVYNLKEKEKIKNKKGILWAIPIELLGLTYFIFNNSLFMTLNLFAIFGLLVLMCMSITGTKITQNRFIVNILNKIFEPLSILFDFISDFKLDKFKEKKNVENDSKPSNVKKVVKSLIIAVPIILVVLCLLASADSVFSNIFKGFFDFISKIFENETIASILFRLVFIFICFVYIAGFIIQFVNEKQTQEKQTQVKSKKLRFNELTMRIILVSLNVLYVIFSFIQFKYLFMNAGKAANFGYAEYARTGFFQLMVVSFINFALLYIAEKGEKLDKILKICLIIFTIIIVISAAFRMHLYEQEYGYTYLRLFVYFTLVTEILILVPVLAKVCGKDVDVFKVGLEIVVVMYVAVNFINMDKIIARNNIDRYLADPNNVEFDAYYLRDNVGTDAAEELIKILKYDEGKISRKNKATFIRNRNEIVAMLNDFKDEYVKDYNPSIQEWNLSKNKIEKLVKDLDLLLEDVNEYEYENEYDLTI